jgi:RNA polymerase sigma-70 factor (ECF subfamily)
LAEDLAHPILAIPTMGCDDITATWSGSRAPGSTSSSLLVQAKAREPAAWQRLVDLYTALLYRWCRQAGLSPQDTADIAQEVFSSVACHLDDFRGTQQHGSFRAWLRGITRSRIADHVRQKRSQPLDNAVLEGLQCADRADPSQALLADKLPETTDGLWQRGLELVRAEFEERTWQAFWRVTVDDQKPADIAEELGMSLQAVYQAKYRVLHRLRWQLADLEGE